jgi:hypothetical protein
MLCLRVQGFDEALADAGFGHTLLLWRAVAAGDGRWPIEGGQRGTKMALRGDEPLGVVGPPVSVGR